MGQYQKPASPQYPPLPATDFGQFVWMLNRPHVIAHFIAALMVLVLWLTRSRLSKAVWGGVVGLFVVDVLFLVSKQALLELREATHLSNVADAKSQNSIPSTEELKRLEDFVHFNSFKKFGRPIRPVRHSEKPISLSATYYRGNDERSSEMLNNGNYRTVTFRIDLIQNAETKVDYNQQVAIEKLAIRVVIDRAPGTSAGYFTEEHMQLMYLTQSSDPIMGSTAPIEDRISLVMTVPEQQWEAVFPIKSRGDTNNERLSGVVYICEERYGVKKQILGGRFHYAIEYDLYVEDGKIRQPSDLWMGATFEGRQFEEAGITPDEWLSLKPLPELPADEQQTTEPNP